MSGAADSITVVLMLACAVAIAPLWTISSSIARIADALEQLRDMAKRGRR